MIRHRHGRAGRWILGLALLLFLGTAALAQSPAVATLKVCQGRVDVMRDSVPWALNSGDTVKPGQIIKTGPDGYAVLEVNDGSTFEVFPNSQATFRANHGDLRDLLDLWIGQVKIQIQKLGGRPNPNRIATPTAVISVRGTVFHVIVEDDGGTTFVLVEEGLVDVSHKLHPGKAISLAEGESIRVYPSQPLAARNIDKGSIAKAAARAVSDAVAEILWRRGTGTGGGSTPAPTGGGGSTGGGAVGDEKAPDAPAPPPPPPPPPPPQ